MTVLILGTQPKQSTSFGFETAMPTTWNQNPHIRSVAPTVLPFTVIDKAPKPTQTNNVSKNESIANAYQPRYGMAQVHPTNYGPRYATDINGVPVSHSPIVVLHETVADASSTINFFQTPHDDENQQASYHALITLDGTVIYLVPPEFRAFGAGNSVFNGANGPETVKTHPQLPSSVNNFAYHVSLETPVDGRNNARTHSGYTEAQYRSLAWLIAQSSVPNSRITTHYAVDKSGTRIDPRSFDLKKFLNLLHAERQNNAKSTR